MTLTQSNAPHGLYTIDGDPTLYNWGQTNLVVGHRIYRSDTSTWWKKTGTAANAWTADPVAV